MAASLRERIATHEAGHSVAAITYGVPIISVTVEDRPHLHRGHYHAPTPDLGFEAIAVICFAGIAAEEYFFGAPIPDPAAIEQDLQMARAHVTHCTNPLQVGVELQRASESAARLVSSPWARERIARLAALLLARGTLSAEEIFAFC